MPPETMKMTTRMTALGIGARIGMRAANAGMPLVSIPSAGEGSLLMHALFPPHTHSGISVQNPDRAGSAPGGNLVRDLLRRAAEYVFESPAAYKNLMRPLYCRAGPPIAPQGAPAPQRRAFFGGGHTLGSDEVESTFVPDPDSEAARTSAFQFY